MVPADVHTHTVTQGHTQRHKHDLLWAGKMAQLANLLPRKHGELSLISSTHVKARHVVYACKYIAGEVGGYVGSLMNPSSLLDEPQVPVRDTMSKNKVDAI